MNNSSTEAKTKTIYIPYMCDHTHAIAAAMRNQKLDAQVLPPADDESLAIGLDLCKGKECLPCFTSTGDIIRHTRRPDFDPERTSILMPDAGGSCRFGQYNVLQKQILADAGLEDVQIVSPSAKNAYQGVGDNPLQLRLVIWQGIVAVDLLQKLLYEYRPYEVNAGQTDEIYKAGLDRIVEGTEKGGGRHLTKAMQWIANQFKSLPVDRSQPRPVIALLGELYLRGNSYANQDLIRQVEAAGGEVMLASIMEFFYYVNWMYKDKTHALGEWLEYITTFASDLYQKYHERRLAKPVASLLKHPYETPVAKTMKKTLPFYTPMLGYETEAGITMGKAIELAEQGVSGIINVMPFSCMPGIIIAGMAPRIRKDSNNIPWLDISYDGQEATNINTRLEAFMYQSVQYQRCMAS